MCYTYIISLHLIDIWFTFQFHLTYHLVHTIKRFHGNCVLSLRSNQMLAYNWQLGSDGLVVVGGWRRPCSLSGVGGWDGEYRMKCYDGGVGSWWQQVTQHGHCHVNIHMPDINIGQCHPDKLVDINIIGIFIQTTWHQYWSYLINLWTDVSIGLSGFIRNK